MTLDDHKEIILKLGFRQEALPQLGQYIDLLWKSNEELNLISRKMTFKELIENHVIDGLLPLIYFPKDFKKIADFGSGGGLPAILYALQFPNLKFDLFEKSPKKREFLLLCQKIVPNLQLQPEIPPSFSGFDLVTARAFKPLDVIFDVSRKYFESNGKYFLLKGRMETIQEEIGLAKKKFKNLKDEQIKIEKLQSPVLDVERHLILINF